MASSLNRVEIIGRLGKDPEVRNLTNGGAVANLSVATSERWKDKRSGEMQEKTEWHRVVIFNDKTVEFVEKYAKKGDLVRVEGKLQTREWEDQQGVKKYSTEIVVANFAPIEAFMKLNFDNDNGGGGSRDDRGGDDRGSSRGGSSRGSSRGRDDDRGGDDRGSSRGRGRDDDRGGDDRGSSRGRGRDDDRGGDDRGGSGRGAPARGGGRNADMDDDIPF
ncbi:single-stranded DNA-binding protein [Bradyrhizobium phage BDU-MI-1]|nr:single-stranded DNA-binding protein [Bradyrhizobium phage BDU-MI-1]